jgi:hypothetical protein
VIREGKGEEKVRYIAPCVVASAIIKTFYPGEIEEYKERPFRLSKQLHVIR